MPDPLRLAVVSDIHHGLPRLTKHGDRALSLLRRFSEFVAAECPDVVVDLGDRITDADRDTDRRLLGDVASVFADIDATRVHLLGNHDVKHLTLADNEAALDRQLTSYGCDIGGWHLSVWNADVRMGAEHEPMLTDDDLAWLASDLASTDLPTVVLTHVPLDAASMTGNFYYQANPEYASYGNAAAAQQVIADSGKVAACVAGHVHWNHLSRIDGVPYVTVQSLTESFTTPGRAAESWAMIELAGDLHWRSLGNDPIELRAARGGSRWTAPLPPFSELRASGAG